MPRPFVWGAGGPEMEQIQSSPAAVQL